MNTKKERKIKVAVVARKCLCRSLESSKNSKAFVLSNTKPRLNAPVKKTTFNHARNRKPKTFKRK